MTTIIELSDYTLAPSGSGHGIQGVYFALSRAQVCAVDADSPDDAHLFLRSLALLNRPVKGTYRFKGRRLNLGDYNALLACKKQIGYIAPDAALISNLTIRQNLLLHRFYYENDLSISLCPDSQRLCDAFDITNKLDGRPAQLNAMETQTAIVIREICKEPEMLLLSRPEDFLGHSHFDLMVQLLNQWIERRTPIVFYTHDRRLTRRYANRKVLITNGSLITVDIKGSNTDV